MATPGRRKRGLKAFFEKRLPDFTRIKETATPA